MSGTEVVAVPLYPIVRSAIEVPSYAPWLVACVFNNSNPHDLAASC